MRLDDERESDNVEDRRGEGGGRSFGVGHGVGIGTILLAVAASYFFGIDPTVILGLASRSTSPAPQSVPAHKPPAEDEMARFVSKVLADTEDTWGAIFRQAGRQYQNPKLVLFTGATPTACGTGQTAMGPFYCPLDHKVYIDLAFYQELRTRFGAPGDFAQAYVIAHEVGHHVQNTLGLLGKGSADSIHVELQADCLAGAWGKSAEHRGLLEMGDVDEALNAASQIGDDTLQRKSQGYVQPETWTHGSAAQRRAAFQKGYQGGPLACGI